MAVLIKGMEMPENCFECPCMRHDSIDGMSAYQCNITLHDGIGDGRPEWCPLVEIPKHGRLIDALLRAEALARAFGYHIVIETIRELPTAEPRKGKWIYGENDCQDGWFCSECRFFIPWDYNYYGLNNINFIKEFHVCPHCKTEMVTYTGKKEDTDE